MATDLQRWQTVLDELGQRLVSERNGSTDVKWVHGCPREVTGGLTCEATRSILDNQNHPVLRVCDFET